MFHSITIKNKILIIYTSFNFILNSIKIFVKSIKVIFKKKIYFNLIQRKKKTSNNSYSENNKYEIAFVPHKGIKYSDFFKKTYLYENLPKSIFYKKKVLTIEFEGADLRGPKQIKIDN